MAQVLLRSNRRFGGFALIAVALAAIVLGGSLVWVSTGWLRWMIAAALGCLAAVAWILWRFTMQPRVALDDNQLVLQLALLRKPFRVPLDVVEVFFIGQGAVSGEEPGQPRGYQGAVAANVIVRLAESAKEWQQHHAVNQRLAVWADGYITVRGLWCEDINQDVLQAMNHQLMQAKRELRGRKANS